MTFLSPALLIGLIATVLPPIIHLLLRRKPKRVIFPSLEFILKSHRKTARRFKIRQLLLMLSRCALLGLLAFSLARPLLTSDATKAVNAIEGGTVVIVVDDSFPMHYELDGESLFTKAKVTASQLIERPNTQFVIIQTGAKPKLLTPSVTTDRGELREIISNLSASKNGRNLNPAVSLASTIAGDGEGTGLTSVVVLSTPAGLASLPDGPTNGSKIKLVPIDVAGGQELPNRAILSARVKPAPQMGASHWEISIRVANYSQEAVTELPVELNVDGKTLVNGFIDIDANAESTKVFYLGLDARMEGKAVARIQADGLSDDDEYPFWLVPTSPVKLLALNGDPSANPYQDELHYLSKLIEPAISAGARIQLKKTTVDRFEDQDLNQYDVVLFANIESITSKGAQNLRLFVGKGGGLLVTCGERTRPDELNQKIGMLLPRTLRRSKYAGDSAASLEGGDRRSAYLKRFDVTHPVLESFVAPETSSLALARINRYTLMDPSADAGGQTVLGLGNGAPILSTKDYQSGRVGMLATSIDRDWTDLAIRPHYLPLMVRLLKFLARSDSTNHPSLDVGSILPLDQLQASKGGLVVQTPDGRSIEVSRLSDEQRQVFKDTKIPGHYTVTTVGQKKPSRKGFSVHVDRRFSRLMSERALSIRELDEQAEARASLESTKELWHFGLLGLFMLLIIETWLLFRMRPSQRQETS